MYARGYDRSIFSSDEIVVVDPVRGWSGQLYPTDLEHTMTFQEWQWPR
jgi:hypothetical protein